MPLAPGTWLGQYEIRSHLGSGGMGEVYRAHDSKLNRDVALKLLPKVFANDPERLARFRREAQVLAQLNHPNIAAIHNLETSGETHFLVLEYVPGETLRERIKRGSTSLDGALDICKQICEGLDHAHEKPIVHRDLKPANVKVTPEGQVKILDFGLAKAFAGDTASTDPSDSPTLSAMTQPGVILGTAAYMSPQQARGKTVDKRADIWALGCVLYELLTGQQAFQSRDPSAALRAGREGAGTVQDILAQVLAGEPDWSALPETTPAHIRFVLKRCLEKDPTRRFHAAGDVRLEIEEARSVPQPAAPAVLLPAAAPPLPVWKRLLPWGVAALFGILLAISTVVILRLSQPPLARSPKRFVINLPATEQLGLVTGGLALSPDGKTLVYVAQGAGVQQLYRRSMDQLETSLIPGTEGGIGPFFSPDGQWVGFSATGKLKKVALAGGPPATICDMRGPGRGAFWGLDDTIVFAMANSGLLRVPAAGGSPQSLTTTEPNKGEQEHREPSILPGGQAVLFTIWSGSLESARIALQDIQTGQRKVLVDGVFPRYVPTGHIVFARERSLWAVPFDVSRLEVTGSPSPLVEGVQVSAGGLALFAVAGDGSLVYRPGAVTSQRRLVWVDRKGTEQPLVAPPRSYGIPRLLPDGRSLAVVIQDDIWVYDIPHGTLSRLTFDGRNSFPIWSPDGKRIAFSSAREGKPNNLFWKPADGSGPEERLSTSEHQQNPHSWSPDGQVIAFNDFAPTTGYDIWVLPLSGAPPFAKASEGTPSRAPASEEERDPRVFLRTQFNDRAPKFSPDGRWLAYASDETGRLEIYVQPFPGPGGKWQISTEGGTEPVWARNGELFYRSGNRMMVVETKTQPGSQPIFSAGVPRLLFEGPYELTSFGAANYDVAADGQRFLMVKAGETGTAPSQLHVVVDWFEELKRRVPAGTNR